jgi:hypothetical protein
MHSDRVYHVEHVVMNDGAKLYAVTDLIFNGEHPIAVLIWAVSQEQNTLWCPCRSIPRTCQNIAMGR